MKKDRYLRSVPDSTWQKLKVFAATHNTTMAESVTYLLMLNQDMALTLAELNALETISESQFDDLKFETNTVRIWLSRMTIEDGMPYNNQVTVEVLHPNGQWKQSIRYQAK